MSIIRNISRWSSAVLLLAVGALWSASLYAASGLPAGTFVLDVANETQSFASTSETVKEVRKNRCQLNQSALTIMEYQSDDGDVSRGDQKQALGVKSQGQDCGFAGAEQAWTFVPVPGGVIPSAAVIGGWEIDFIVTDDAVFEIVLLGDSGTPLRLLDASGTELTSGGSPVEAFKIYTGRSACSDGGVPISLEDWEQAVFPCVAQSNPNSDFDAQAGFRPDASLNTFGADLSLPNGVRQVRISVIEGNVGINAAEFDFELIPTGTLTCEGGGPGDTITDEIGFDGIIQVGDGVQCRRLPNRSETACVAVPYLLDASCDAITGDCDVNFLHGDQLGVDRDEFAFVCEVWWPSREGNFTLSGVGAEPILDRTEVSWGGLTGPLVQGDDLNYCQGITPLFSGADCGSDLDYKLSGVGPIDGGTVSDNVGTCSLLEAFDDVLLLAPDVPNSPPDQCDAVDCPDGRQLACLMQERIVVEEDPAPYGVSGELQGPGRIDEAANPKFRKYELIFIEGDIRLRGIR